MMPTVRLPGARRLPQRCLLRGAMAGLLFAMAAQEAAAEGSDAARLREKYEASVERLRDSVLGQPLLLESSESGDLLSGEIYARVDHGVGELAQALDDPRQWCEFLLLHPNVARCEAGGSAEAPLLGMDVTRQIDSAESHHLAFALQRMPSTPDYYAVELAAASGPMGTSDYHIRVEGLALDGNSMFLHLRYSNRAGWPARLALKAWLATLARDCVGFTVTGTSRRGEPEYIRGVRGSAERNVMRYFLAIGAFLRARNTPADERFNRSLAFWLEDIARYPRQLQDEDIPPYLAIKRRSVQPGGIVSARR